MLLKILHSYKISFSLSRFVLSDSLVWLMLTYGAAYLKKTQTLCSITQGKRYLNLVPLLAKILQGNGIRLRRRNSVLQTAEVHTKTVWRTLITYYHKKVSQSISKFINLISRLIYCLIFSILSTTFKRH